MANGTKLNMACASRGIQREYEACCAKFAEIARKVEKELPAKAGKIPSVQIDCTVRVNFVTFKRGSGGIGFSW